jgi:hypothetical protein
MSDREQLLSPARDVATHGVTPVSQARKECLRLDNESANLYTPRQDVRLLSATSLCEHTLRVLASVGKTLRRGENTIQEWEKSIRIPGFYWW